MDKTPFCKKDNFNIVLKRVIINVIYTYTDIQGNSGLIVHKLRGGGTG